VHVLHTHLLLLLALAVPCVQGTLTHMAPELLLTGRASQASDMYAAGILLWELFTGLRPWEGVGPALLPAKVVQAGARPPWPAGCEQHIPQRLRDLTEAVWAQEPAARWVPTAALAVQLAGSRNAPLLATALPCSVRCAGWRSCTCWVAGRHEALHPRCLYFCMCSHLQCSHRLPSPLTLSSLLIVALHRPPPSLPVPGCCALCCRPDAAYMVQQLEQLQEELKWQHLFGMQGLEG
jgi:hypothetical protein